MSAQGIWLKSCRVCLCPLWFKKHAFFLLMYDHILVALAWCGHEKCNQSLYKHAIQSMREVLLKFSRQIIRLLLRPPWHFSIHTSRHFSTNLDWVLSFQPPENHFFSSSAFPIFICIVVSTPTFWGYNLDMHAFCMQLFPPGPFTIFSCVRSFHGFLHCFMILGLKNCRYGDKRVKKVTFQRVLKSMFMCLASN